jgi:RND family efflux transporter MFP subunit
MISEDVRPGTEKHMPLTRFLVCLFAILLPVAAGCGMKHTAKPRLAEVERLPWLETSLPERTTLLVRAEYTATVDSLEKADLCAQVRGTVKTIPEDVDIGRLVKANEPLVTLDIPDIVAERDSKKALLEQARNLQEQAVQARRVVAEEVKEAQALEKRYQADVEYRGLQYNRTAKLAQAQTVQPQLAEEAQLQLNSAKAALKASQAQVQTKLAKQVAADVEVKVAESRIKVAQAEVERLEALVGFATIKAPFDGIITKRWVDRGATVKDSAMPLLTVMRTDVMRVILDIPERDVPHVRAAGKPSPEEPGNPVTLRLPALLESVHGGEFKGRVTRLAGSLDPATRTMRTEVDLDNKTGYLRPQMTGTAQVLLGEREHVLCVPSSALVRVGDKVEVYYVADAAGEPRRGVVRRAEVELGLDDGKRVEIRRGLTGQELVIVKGNGVVRVGDPAVAVPARGDAK